MVHQCVVLAELRAIRPPHDCLVSIGLKNPPGNILCSGRADLVVLSTLSTENQQLTGDKQTEFGGSEYDGSNLKTVIPRHTNPVLIPIQPSRYNPV
jgi:hypothetical protein